MIELLRTVLCFWSVIMYTYLFVQGLKCFIDRYWH